MKRFLICLLTVVVIGAVCGIVGNRAGRKYEAPTATVIFSLPEGPIIFQNVTDWTLDGGCAFTSDNGTRVRTVNVPCVITENE